MRFTEKEKELAKELKSSGLKWSPQVGDWYSSAHKEDIVKKWEADWEVEGESTWLPLWHQCREIIRVSGYYLVEYRETAEGVLIGINKDGTSIHAMTSEGKTDLEGMYKIVKAIMKLKHSLLKQV